jgi:hypothetical protein
LLSKEQKDERSVARDDDSSTVAGNIIILLITQDIKKPGKNPGLSYTY